MSIYDVQAPTSVAAQPVDDGVVQQLKLELAQERGELRQRQAESETSQQKYD